MRNTFPIDAASGRGLIALALLLAAAPGARAHELTAVLSSGAGAYAQSMAGFEQEWGQSVPKAVMPDGTVKVSRGVRVVVAFGAKAATRSYPDDLTLIYWAPGLRIENSGRREPAIKIHLGARPDILAALLKELQPKLADLRIFFMADAHSAYIDEMRAAAAPLGFNIHADKLSRTDELPDRIRAMEKKPDAVLLLNDPLLINAQTFTILKNYSWSNAVPLYAPTAGLVEQGATASIGPSFNELGRAAARAAREVLSGKRNPNADAYSDVIEIAFNRAAAEKTGIAPDEDFLKKVRKVFP